MNLKRYDDHPDFIANRAHCDERSRMQKSMEPAIKDKMSDLVVWIRIVLDNMDKGDAQPSECARNVRSDLIALHEYLLSVMEASNIGWTEYYDYSAQVVENMSQLTRDAMYCTSDFVQKTYKYSQPY